MTVDSVITLDNDVNCLLLEKVTHENENYVEAVADANLQAELIKLFTNEVGKLVESLPDEF